MKRLLCLILTLLMLTGLAVPALAADTTDRRLAAVTQAVKQTLGMDTDAFDTFQGDFYEDALSPVWNLRWSGDEGNLTVEADEGGRIYSYYHYDRTETSPDSGRFNPTFPRGDETAARAAAGDFLSRVLDGSLESVELQPDTFMSLGATRYNYSGVILLHGLPSPLSYRISVRAADNAVVRFSRDSYYTKLLGEIPTAKPSAPLSAAGGRLKSTLALRLEYVLDSGGKTALLRYLPERGDEYYVDAQTGALVNLTELYEAVRSAGDYGLNDAAEIQASVFPAGGAADKLTEAEIAGVAKLEDALSKETLDAALRQISALGLDSYTLVAASYWADPLDDSVYCRLQYGRQSEDGLWRRYVAVDAKSGALKSISSSVPYYGEDKGPAVTVDHATARQKAEDFLSGYFSGNYAKLDLYDNGGGLSVYSLGNDGYTYRYAHKENGYFYVGNYYTVSIDRTDGSISALQFNFDGDVAFDSADGLISMADAVDAWFDTYRVETGYLAIPEKLDPAAPEYEPLTRQGYTYLYSLRLAYFLEREGYVAGIDAKTGKPVRQKDSPAPALTYNDLSGHWIQTQAEKLAQFKIGWLGGSFRPGQTLTQLDLLCLLVSTNGYLRDPEGDDETSVDRVYDIAYSMGLLTPAERSEGSVISRGELVKLILNAGGYGKVAGLSGIFRCGYKDERAIPAEYYGYAALAQGLGIIKGDGKGNFDAGRPATRAEAAAALYNLMSR